MLGVLVPFTPELIEVPAEIDVGVADGGEFAEVSWPEVFEGEEAAELVGPELIGIEQLVELPGLEIVSQEEVTEVSLELIGPKGIYE